MIHQAVRDFIGVLSRNGIKKQKLQHVMRGKTLQSRGQKALPNSLAVIFMHGQSPEKILTQMFMFVKPIFL